ncbi:MAG: prepilin-type N-terminal cleavage/methylation domain-containing protein [bacterium]|nr:prepilin-type N-terminal cleavage/methylation domain-containing protein [bacterium]
MKNIQSAFTLIEVLVVLGILTILVGLTIPAFRYFGSGASLKNSTGEVISILRTAQNKTLASEGANQWGVYFSTSTNQYVLFQGTNYASRNASFDEPHNPSSGVEIYQADLGGGGEVVFDRVTGRTNFPGSLSLRLKTEPLKVETVYIESSGRAGTANPSIPGDEDRLKDSRHVHFNYSRFVATSTEKVNLIFTYDSQVFTKEIIIADNLKEGQFYWEGEVSVGGENQRIEIQTHSLDNPNTQFSIRRDGRYNTKALTVEINGDASGDLIRYDASGQTAKGASIYVSEPFWQ